ncbi:wax ester/triacylglycerol synthase family O-acyltransferase [Actinomadura barringtoniae]|uniref:Diacylglycerol O-acyltransferase n=1 Tax=Actinomadura barringtoniae TaxID=1427535 RepID=A0A939P6L6_9ACTN|nr:wax ester/triacylglycerol synthase family O-acyltransferase [Actinomadura barringtoniae]MBO2446390.1 wax ester/triacylglycerol synthase family O-acyltransferase [Actinomadura barringtoniae]
MSGLDASFYLLENENTPLHVASVVVFEGPAPSYGDLVRAIVAKLPLVPRYRQRVRSVPLHLGRPVWADDPHFQVLYHVRHTALPAPGNDEQLRNLAGRVLAQRLDPDKPLWEIWLVEGLTDDRWAMIAKVHHCMVDGVAGMDLATVLFDLGPDYEPPGEPEEWEPAPEPSALELLADSAQRSVTQPVRQANDVVRGLSSLGTSLGLGNTWGVSVAETLGAGRARGLRDFAMGLSRVAGRFTHPSAGSLNGPIGPHRRWCWQQLSLDDAKTIRKALGGTINDVVLAAVTAGYRDLLNARDELTHDTCVRSAVPVSVRSTDEQGELNNRVAAVFVNLPVGVDDPLERLRRIREQTDDVKGSNQATGTKALTRLTDTAVAPALLSLAARLPVRLRQDLVQTVTTNVPGPGFPLYMMGRRVLELHPYVPLTGGIRVATAIISYCGALHFGITGDFDGMPDLDLLAKGIQAGFDELLTEAGKR